MAGTNYRNQRGWRRLTGWLAAYLLVLHVGFAGISVGHYFAQANEAIHGSFCLNGTGDPSSPADAPAHPSHGNVHCLLCAGGGSLALSSAEIPAALQPILASALLSVSEQAAAQSRRYSPHRSRAPPIEV
jgi:hypothetical protein